MLDIWNKQGIKTKLSVAFGILSLLVLFVFMSIFNNGFINFDDDIFIYNNQFIRVFNIKSIKLFFIQDIYTPKYKPLVYLTWAAIYNEANLSAGIFHATSLFFHILNSGLVFLLFYHFIKKLNNSQNIQIIFSLIGALVFAINPAKVETVAWAVSLKDMLFSFFFLSSLIGYLRYLSTEKYKWIMASVLAFALGILCKPTMITLPFVLFIVDYLSRRSLNIKLLLEKLPHFAVLILGLFLYGIFSASHAATEVTYNETGIANHLLAFQETSLLQKFVFSCYRYVMIAWHIISPQNHTILYAIPSFVIQRNISVTEWIYPFMLLIMLAWAFFRRKKSRFALAGILFFMITLLPILSFSGNETSFTPDRYGYLPSLCWSMAVVGISLFLMKQTNTTRVILFIILGTYLFCCGIASSTQCSIWKNNLTLWSDVIKKNPQSYIGHNQLGSALIDEGNFQDAILNLNNAVNFNNHEARIYYNRGIAYFNIHSLQNAEQDFSQAITLDKNYAKAYYNRGMTYIKLQNYQAAFNDFNVLLSQNPNDVMAHLYRGMLNYQLQHKAAACTDWQQSAQAGNEKAAKLLNQYCK